MNTASQMKIAKALSIDIKIYTRTAEMLEGIELRTLVECNMSDSTVLGLQDAARKTRAKISLLQAELVTLLTEEK